MRCYGQVGAALGTCCGCTGRGDLSAPLGSGKVRRKSRRVGEQGPRWGARPHPGSCAMRRQREPGPGPSPTHPDMPLQGRAGLPWVLAFPGHTSRAAAFAHSWAVERVLSCCAGSGGPGPCSAASSWSHCGNHIKVVLPQLASSGDKEQALSQHSQRSWPQLDTWAR